MKRQLYMRGGIMDIVPREQALLGGVKKAVKKVTKGVKDIVSSDVGKAALLAAGAYALGGSQFLGGQGIFATGQGLQRFRNLANLPSAISGLFTGVPNVDAPDLDIVKGKFSTSPIGKFLASKAGGNITKLATLGAVSSYLTKTLGMTVEQAEEELARDPSQYLELYYRNLNPPGDKDPEVYEEEVREFVRINSADGGRIGFANGPVLPPDPTQPVNPFGPKPGDFGIEEDIPIKMASNIENDKILQALFEKYLDMGMSPIEAEKAAFAEFERMSKREEKFFNIEDRGLAAIGGKMDTASDNAMQAAGIEGLPIRQNPKGVKELDLRKTGGFIQPVGIKEKADDIPAMLSNNEFVFTADAVRGAGGGDVNLGAQRMYDTMKRLEVGGKA